MKSNHSPNWLNFPRQTSALRLPAFCALFFAALTAGVHAQTPSPVFSNVWNLATGVRSYVTTGGTERGITVNPATGHVLLVSRTTSPPTIKVLDGNTGADLGSLNNSGISGGTFTLNQIGVSSDGVIYAANLSATTPPVYKIYRWDHEDTTGAVTPVAVWNGTPGTGTGRYGDSFAVGGNGTNTVIVGSGSSNPNLSIFTFADNNAYINGTLTSTEIPLSTASLGAGEAGKGLSVGLNNSIYARNSSGSSMHHLGFNLANSTLSLIENITVDATTAPISVDNVGHFLVSMTVANNTTTSSHLFKIWDISNPASPLVLVSTNDPSPITADSNVTGEAGNDGTHYVGIEAANGIVAYKLIGYVTNLPPTLSGQPVGLTAMQGGYCSFKVTATGTDPLKYLWYYGTTNVGSTNSIPGATNATLNLTNLVATNAGNYFVTVTNSFGAKTSAVATLVIQPAVLSNLMNPIWSIPPGTPGYPYIGTDDRQRGICYNPATDHVLVATRSPIDPSIFIINAANGANAGQMNLSGVTGGTFDLNLVCAADDGAVFACNLTTAASGGSPLNIYRWDSDNTNATPTEIFTGDPGATAGLRWGDTMAVRGAGTNTQILLVQQGTVNAALFTTQDGTSFSETFLTANVSLSAGLGLAFGDGNSYWVKDFGGNLRHYAFDPNAGTATQLQVITNLPTGSAPMAFDGTDELLAIMSVRDNPDNLRLYDVENLQNPSIPWLDTKFVPVNNLNSFGVGAVAFGNGRVYGLDTDNGLIAETLSLPQAAPVITTQPATITTNLGSTVTFGVNSSGFPRSTFQWYFNGTPIDGATSGSYPLVNITDANAGTYSVLVSNAMGNVTSSNASLLILPSIFSQSSDLIVNTNDPASFSVSADGQPTLVYQWRLNGSNLTDNANISGSTTPNLFIANAQISDAGKYTCLVTNVAGSAVSQPMVLTVTFPVADGNGTGLNGDYYSNQLQTFNGQPTLTRLDPQINFDWNTGSPDSLLSTDRFTVRWSGWVLPKYSQTYTFYATTDDGVRLWVNGQKVIDAWVGRPATESSGAINLIGGQQYPLIMEYFENTGFASAVLSWSSASEAKAVIPATQLFPATSPIGSTIGFTQSGTNLVFNWVGSFHLQSATNVNGPWSDVTNAGIAPFTVNVNAAPSKFFRLRNQ